MKKQVCKPLMAGFIALLLVGLCGCGTTKPGPAGRYTIDAKLDESLRTSSVIVDLVGVNPSSLPRWEAYDMSKYWNEGDSMRRDADKKVLNFVSGQALSQSLPATDPLWDKWKGQGVTHVLVLADLPGTQTSRPGNQDPRRQILPLSKSHWPRGTKTLSVLVQRSGIVVLTPTRQ
jgi:hypothetical protein